MVTIRRPRVYLTEYYCTFWNLVNKSVSRGTLPEAFRYGTSWSQTLIAWYEKVAETTWVYPLEFTLEETMETRRQWDNVEITVFLQTFSGLTYRDLIALVCTATKPWKRQWLISKVQNGLNREQKLCRIDKVCSCHKETRFSEIVGEKSLSRSCVTLQILAMA